MESIKGTVELKMADQKVLSNIFPELDGLAKMESIAWNKQSFQPGEVMFSAGQPCNRFLLMGKGSLRVEIQNEQGRSVVLYRIEPGQLCIHSLINLINDDNYSFNAVAETDGWFCWTTKGQFQNWMEKSPQFQHWIFNNIGSRFKQVVDRFAQHAFLPVEARLAGLLIEKMGVEQKIQIKQSQLAAELGTAREIISRHLSRWQKQGMLETSRGEIKIIEIEKLVNLAV